MAHHGFMLLLVLGMLLSVGLAVAVVCMVAVPARREGRDLLTPKGEEMVSLVREKTGSAVETAREKTGEAFDAAREKVADVTKPNEP
jgi:hypothetical protein